MSTETLDAPPQTPFTLMGGIPTVRRLVDRFYDLMEEDPAYAALRDLHAPDSSPCAPRSPAFSQPGSADPGTGSPNARAPA